MSLLHQIEVVCTAIVGLQLVGSLLFLAVMVWNSRRDQVRARAWRERNEGAYNDLGVGAGPWGHRG